MTRIDVSICDVCGKRANKDELIGRLTLQKKVKGRKYYQDRTITERSWAVCKKCFRKIAATQTDGDTMKEELEMRIDTARIKRNRPNLLLTSE